MYNIEDMWRGHEGVLHPREQAERLLSIFGSNAKMFISEIKENKMVYLDDSRNRYWDVVLNILNEEP